MSYIDELVKKACEEAARQISSKEGLDLRGIVWTAVEQGMAEAFNRGIKTGVEIASKKGN